MDNLLQNLSHFYQLLASKTSELENIHKNRLQCQKGCSQCCIDGISIFEIEAKHIQENVDFDKIKINEELNQCVFLDKNGACQIYEFRPYVCRTQGLPLRWIEENIEYRDICPLNENENDITLLKMQECFDATPFEETLAVLQLQQDNGKMKRVLLRDLIIKGE